MSHGGMLDCAVLLLLCESVALTYIGEDRVAVVQNNVSNQRQRGVRVCVYHWISKEQHIHVCLRVCVRVCVNAYSCRL
jgi:hypothetical protein